MPKMNTTLSTKCQGEGCEKDRRHRSRYCSVECLFWDRLDKTPGHGPNGDCWIWTGSVIPNTSYGAVDSYTAGGKRTSAHRRAYQLAYTDPGDQMVLHKCDVRLCANPEYLFLGDHRANWLDAISKNRHVISMPGEANANAKLTVSKVQAIRQSPAIVPLLSRLYGVDDMTIRRVLSGRTWGHVTDDPGVVYLFGVIDRPAPVMQLSA